MHNDTPLGFTLHLKELDRQAGPKSVSLRSKAQRSSLGSTFGAVSVGLLRLVRAFVTRTRTTGGHELQTFPTDPLSST